MSPEAVLLTVAGALIVLAWAGTALAWWLLRPDLVLALEREHQRLEANIEHLGTVVVPAAKIAAETIYERAEDMFDAAEVKRRRAAASASGARKREEAPPQEGGDDNENAPREERLAALRARLAARA